MTYTFLSADYPGAAQSMIDDGNGTTAVGTYSFDPTGPSAEPPTAFTVTGRTYKTLPVPGSVASFANGINADGLIVGTYVDQANVEHGFAIDKGVFSTIDAPNATVSGINAVTDSGDFLGGCTDTAGDSHVFVRRGGNFTFIDVDVAGATTVSVTGMNSAGDIVGTYWDVVNYHSFLLRGGVRTPINFPFANITIVHGINDSGQIAGYYGDSAAKMHGFVYQDGAFASVDVAGASHTVLSNVTNTGLVTGFYIDASGEAHGLIGR